MPVGPTLPQKKYSDRPLTMGPTVLIINHPSGPTNHALEAVATESNRMPFKDTAVALASR